MWGKVVGEHPLVSHELDPIWNGLNMSALVESPIEVMKQSNATLQSIVLKDSQQ